MNFNRQVSAAQTLHKQNAGTLIHIEEIGDFQPPTQVGLEQHHFPEEMEKWLDGLIQKTVLFQQYKEEVLDDLIPAVTVWYGIAEQAAFVGGGVSFGNGTSYFNHIPDIYERLDDMSLYENNPWLRMVIDGMRYIISKADGRYALKLRGGAAPGELASFIRGNDLYTDFYDCPEDVHRLMKFCTQAEKWFIKHQTAITPPIGGGVIDGFGIWLPGNSFGHLAEDWATMCSPDIFNEFGKPYTQELTANFDHCMMHTHSAAEYLLKHIAAIDKLTHIEISSDPQALSAMDVYVKNAECLDGKIIIVNGASQDEIKAHSDFLKERKSIIKYRAKDKEDAKAAVDYVKTRLN